MFKSLFKSYAYYRLKFFKIRYQIWKHYALNLNFETH